MEDMAMLRSKIISKERATRVMQHKWLLDNLSRVGIVHGIRIEPSSP